MTAEPSPAAIKAARDRAMSKHLHPLVVQLTDARNRHAIEQGEVGARLGYDNKVISRWETGDRRPTIFNLQCWAAALGFDLSLVERIGS